MITGQYKKHIIHPEVSTTPASGCFPMGQTDTLTNRLNWWLYNLLLPENQVSKKWKLNYHVWACDDLNEAYFWIYWGNYLMKKIELFCSNFSIFQERWRVAIPNMIKNLFCCLGLNIFKENGEGWQKPNTLRNFSQYEIDLK